MPKTTKATAFSKVETANRKTNSKSNLKHNLKTNLKTNLKSNFESSSKPYSKIPNDFEFLQKIGNRIKIIRQVRGITLAQLSEATKIDLKKLLRYEDGKDPDFSLETLIIIADALNVKSSTFL